MDMIKIPKRIQIGNRYYEVRIVSDLSSLEGRVAYGTTNHLLYTIDIDAKRQTALKAEVFLHEVIHIIQDVYELDGLTETTIQCLAVNLLQLLTQLGLKFEFESRS